MIETGIIRDQSRPGTVINICGPGMFIWTAAEFPSVYTFAKDGAAMGGDSDSVELSRKTTSQQGESEDGEKLANGCRSAVEVRVSERWARESSDSLGYTFTLFLRRWTSDKVCG